MKLKNISFKHKKEKIEMQIAVMESVTELHQLDPIELLKTFNFGSETLARLQKIGKDPFKRRKVKYKLDATKLDDDTIEMLKDRGAIVR